MPAWRPDRGPPALEQPQSSKRRLRGGGTGEGADPEVPGQAGGPPPSPPSRASRRSGIPCAAFLCPFSCRSVPRRVPALSAGASAEAAAVRRVTGRAPPPGWGLGLQLPEREEKGEVKGEGPPEVPPPQCGRGRRRGRSPLPPPRRGWCIPCDVRSSPPLPGWCALSDAQLKSPDVAGLECQPVLEAERRRRRAGTGPSGPAAPFPSPRTFTGPQSAGGSGTRRPRPLRPLHSLFRSEAQVASSPG